MTTLIVDASVLPGWFVPGWPQTLSDKMAEEYILIAPDLVLAEVGNALWKAVRTEAIKKEDALTAMRVLPRMFARLCPLAQLHVEAAKVSFFLNHPIYDCFYLALAQREGAALVTCDKRLAQAARKLSHIEVQFIAAV